MTIYELLRQIRALAVSGNNGKAITWNSSTESLAATTLVSDHGNLTGLTDDDHAGYARLAGRASSQTLIGGTAANEDLTLKGTSHGTKDTSFVLIQPDGGKVGVGTTVPASLVDINMGTAGAVQLSYNDADGTPANYATMTLSENAALTITTVDVDGSLGHLVLAPDGNVGIKVASPIAALDIGSGAIAFTEVAAPDAPADTKAVLYAKDVGGGKTALYVRFASGAEQVVATEP